MKNIRTDLAIEQHELLMETAEELSGVAVTEEDRDGLHISRVKIETGEAEQAMGKPIGNYITIEIPALDNALSDTIDSVAQIIADELERLIPMDKDKTVLAAGLGNSSITPDSLGPKVISKLMVTRHLLSYIPDQIDEKIHSVCAVSPGVLGITGIETSEILKGIADSVKPDAIIVIDALAARNINRITKTVQLSDTGISPGAGVGNNRTAMNSEYFGVPVIAIGVPTVIDAVTITADTLDSVLDNMKSNVMQNSEFFKVLNDMNDDKRKNLLKSSLSDDFLSFIAAPSNIDILIEKISKVVANGINLAMHRGISLDDVEAYVE